jgi:hypothetical protein
MSPQETRSNYEDFVCNQQLQSLLQGHIQGRGVHVTGVSAAYTFKLNKNILSE